MKNIKKAIGLSLFALSFGTMYGCAFENKKETLITQVSVTPPHKHVSNTVKIALLLDTSNSMDGLSEKLFSLKTNGGEEYCGTVIQTSLNQLDWGKNPDHLKMIFIAGNEPFTQGKINYKDAVTNAKEKNIIINTIFCGNYEQGVSTEWKNGAVLTGGDYIAIDHNKHVVHIDTPYDAKIVQLNSKLNTTYVSYGTLGKAKLEKQYLQDSNAMEVEEAVAVKRAVSKSSRLYNNATWDLVDASDDKDFDVKKIDKEQLPEVLKNKTDKEIETYIEAKKNERKKIQSEIIELNKQRDSFIAKNQKENATGELESAMLNAIKKQAEKKNYKWDE